jgi:hypothetical protein
MHVQGNPLPRSARPPFAAAVVALFAGVVGTARAADFDERLAAPQMKSAADLHARAQAFFARDTEQRVQGLGALVRSRQLAQERFDVAWQLERAIDDKRPIGDLSALGVVDRGDGTYAVDLSAYPQWTDPAERLATLLVALDPADSAVGQELMNRGMSAQDLAKLRAYVAAHRASAATGPAALPVSIGFSRVVRKFDKLKRPVPDALVRSYLYQRERAVSEARRVWAVSLVDAIGPAAARILDSYFGETHESGVWGPSDSRAGIDDLLDRMQRPDFELKAAAEVKEVAP